MKRSKTATRRGGRQPTNGKRRSARTCGLPRFLRPYFWEYDFRVLSWEAHSYFVTGRILEEGGWRAICWLRNRLGDDGLRGHLYRRQGRGLSRRQLRYWEVILELPKRDVDAWLSLPGRQIWDNRGKLPCPNES